MTVQKPIARQESPDYPFRRRYSRHKVWIALKNGESKTHYAKDCSATLKQLQWKKVSHVRLSQKESIDDCLAIERAFRGRYRTIQIYRRNADGTWPKEPILKFVNGKQVGALDDCLPEDVFCRVHYTAPAEDALPGTPYKFELVPVAAPVADQATVKADPVIPDQQMKVNAALIRSNVDRISQNWNRNNI